MALPLAVPAVLGIMRFAAQKGVTAAIKKYGRSAYNAALGVAKDKGPTGQQVRSQLQRVAERSKEQASNIPKSVRNMMIPKGSNKTLARREAPMRAERDTPVTPKKESTRERVAERKERMAKGEERRKASETTPRRNASATTAGVAGATAIASSVKEKDSNGTPRTGGGRGDGAAEMRARRAEAKRKKDSEKPKTYKIKKGDTLSEIARDNGTSVEELAKKNNIKDPDMIYAGRTLKLNQGGMPKKVNCGASMKPAQKSSKQN